jgi:hypothetical protein
VKNTGFYLIILAVILIIGCPFDEKINGNGDITSTERIATGFSGVYLEGVGNVNIHFSENCKVIVTTDNNIQDIVTIETKNNLLYIDEKRGNGINPTKLIIDVYLPELENITLKGAGNIKIDNGNASVINLTISGAGNIEAQDYEVGNVNIVLSGTGNLRTWVTNNLSGSISGVGNIYYKGNPTININRTGIGDIKRL